MDKQARRKQLEIVSQLAARAVSLAAQHGVSYKHMDAFMDLDAAFQGGYLSRIEELLAADDGNFAHDVFGIRRHLNRTTGKMEDCFLPRYA